MVKPDGCYLNEIKIRFDNIVLLNFHWSFVSTSRCALDLNINDELVSDKNYSLNTWSTTGESSAAGDEELD
jgi:hypothetical protein